MRKCVDCCGTFLAMGSPGIFHDEFESLLSISAWCLHLRRLPQKGESCLPGQLLFGHQIEAVIGEAGMQSKHRLLANPALNELTRLKGWSILVGRLAFQRLGTTCIWPHA